MLLPIFAYALYAFQFDDRITDEDYHYAELILLEHKVDTVGRFNSFDSELKFIAAVQQAVINSVLDRKGIPQFQERSIKNFYLLKTGLCYDFSHTIEKILKIYGFQTRHISLYYYQNAMERIVVAFNPQSHSHAASEVKTSRGWMYLDSLTNIIGLSSDNQPLDLSAIRKQIENGTASQQILNNNNYREKFVFVYGIYSRNGKFYAPYTAVPDYQLSELKYNFMR